MRAVICAVNSSYIHSSLAAAIIYNDAMKTPNIDACIVELNINENPATALDKLYSQQGDVYLFSCYIWNINYIKALVSDLKKVHSCIVVIGGPEVSHSPSYALSSFAEADYAVMGNAEYTTRELLFYLDSGDRADLFLENVYSHESIDKISDAPAAIFDFSTREFPYSESTFGRFDGKIVYYESMRGCPYSCTFCLSGNSGSLSFVEIQQVEEEIMFFINNKAKLVKFIDRTFNANLSRAKRIVRFIIENNISTTFHFEVCLNSFDEELTNLFANAPKGYFQLEAGLQSVNQKTLGIIKRKTDIVSFRKTLHSLLENDNVHVHTDLIAMLPEETLESFFYGFDFLFYLSPHTIQLGFLKVLKGTQMYADADRHGIVYSSEPPYEALKTSKISYSEKTLLQKISFLTEKYFNSGLFSETLNALCIGKDISPHSLFSMLSEYFTKNGLFGMSHSQKSLFMHFQSFIAESGHDMDSYLAIDYINTVSLRLPSFLMGSVREPQKSEVFDYINNNASVFAGFPTLQSKSAKEIYKRIAIYAIKGIFGSEPVMFVDEMEDKTRSKRKRAAANITFEAQNTSPA